MEKTWRFPLNEPTVLKIIITIVITENVDTQITWYVALRASPTPVQAVHIHRRRKGVYKAE